MRLHPMHENVPHWLILNFVIQFFIYNILYIYQYISHKSNASLNYIVWILPICDSNAENLQQQAGAAEGCCPRACLLPHSVARVCKLRFDKLHRFEAGKYQLRDGELWIFLYDGGSRGRQGGLHRPRSPQWLLWRVDWNTSVLRRGLRISRLREGWMVSQGESGGSLPWENTERIVGNG